MLVTQMGIPFDHAQGLVPQNFGNFHRAYPTHRELGCGTVAEVMEAEIWYASMFPVLGVMKR
jgi:hypothetical protein